MWMKYITNIVRHLETIIIGANDVAAGYVVPPLIGLLNPILRLLALNFVFSYIYISRTHRVCFTTHTCNFAWLTSGRRVRNVSCDTSHR